MITSPNEIIFRASGIGKIMGENGLTENQLKTIAELQAKDKLTDKQSATLNDLIYRRDNPELPETCKTNLIDIFASAMYSRREDVDSKFLSKGNECEEDSITLLSVVNKKYFIKNTKRLTDDYVTGEWDLHDSIRKINETTDIKTSWSLHTFLRATNKKLNDDYYWQGQTYMHLTGAESHNVAFCLVNGTADEIDREKNKLSYIKGMLDNQGNESPEFIRRCQQIEINHIFDITAFKKKYPYYSFHNKQWDFDIPKERRVFVFSFKRNQSDIEKMIKRIQDCRSWIGQNFKQHFVSEFVSQPQHLAELIS